MWFAQILPLLNSLVVALKTMAQKKGKGTDLSVFQRQRSHTKPRHNLSTCSQKASDYAGVAQENHPN
jgi:hypothetical protein